MKKRKCSLYDKVYDVVNLKMAWYEVANNKGSHGVDGETIEQFEEMLDYNVRVIQKDCTSHIACPNVEVHLHASTIVQLNY